MKTSRGIAIGLLTGLAACSPSLNWRSVPVEQVSALLPCKPDAAKRQVDIGGTQRTLSMWGCEAGGALFAVSHLRVEAPAYANQVSVAWQAAALQNLAGAAPEQLPFQAPTSAAHKVTAGTMIRAQGKRADGQPVQAQLAWFSDGADVYHLAVYAADLTPAMTETFFTEWQWQ